MEQLKSNDSFNLDNYLFRIPESEYKFFKNKENDFAKLPIKKRKKWYYKHYLYYKKRLRLNHRVNRLQSLRLPLHLSFLRWVYIDFIVGKIRKFFGIYMFVALPGEGKTLSMVAHMERARSTMFNLIIATNFGYKHQDYAIEHWSDIVKVAMIARKQHCPCIIAMDEIHVTFDASNWQNFPAELLSLLSFNRKFSLQFLCSAQIYERIPRKIRDIANYTVICKNVLGLDRLFKNYYFDKDAYDAQFSGKPAKAKFLREFVATDELYSLYDTLAQVEDMKAKASVEKSKKEEAFQILFGQNNQEAEDEEVPGRALPIPR